MAVYRTRSFRAARQLVLMFLVLAGCDEEERHRVKTVLFDGVPPLRADTSGGGAFDPNEPGDVGPLATGGWYVHEPLKDCTQCHASRRRARFSREVQLVAEVPQLCFQCHEEYAALPGWVHGPVVAGDCAFCHEPHKTKTAFLLTAPVPDLCYRCHDAEALGLIPNHAETSYARCNQCHAGHNGVTRYLLRPEFLDSEAGRSYRLQAYRQQYERALRKARADLTQGWSIADMLRMAVDHIKGDRLWEARATLEVVTDSKVISADERQSIAAILPQVIAWLEGEPESEADRAELAASLDAVQDQRSRREEALAELYYRSIQLYRAGHLGEARVGFAELLRSGALPEPVRRTAQRHLTEIDRALGRTQGEEPLQPEP